MSEFAPEIAHHSLNDCRGSFIGVAMAKCTSLFRSASLEERVSTMEGTFVKDSA